MNNLSIEIGKKCSLSPVTKEELMSSTYSLLSILRILNDSCYGLCDCFTSGGAVEWSASLEEKELVEKSVPWSYLLPMWLYAEKGELTPLAYGVHLDDAIGDLVKWLCAIGPISEYSGEDSCTPILKVITKFFARLKLDFDLDLNEGKKINELPSIEDGCITINSGWLPQIDNKYLTVVEVALLAGISNIRTVRNAQYDKENPLHFFKEGRKVLVKNEAAKKWLLLRRGYIPTKTSFKTKE